MIILNSVARIIEASRSQESSVPHWFNESTMAFFNTTVQTEVHTVGRFGTLFVTKDGPEPGTRAYTIRWAYYKDNVFHITTLGDVMAFATRGAAYGFIETLAEMLPDIVRSWE